MNDKWIKLGVEAGLLNYIDLETPRQYFIDGNAEVEEVMGFARLVAKDEAERPQSECLYKEVMIDKYRDALLSFLAIYANDKYDADDVISEFHKIVLKTIIPRAQNVKG